MTGHHLWDVGATLAVVACWFMAGVFAVAAWNYSRGNLVLTEHLVERSAVVVFVISYLVTAVTVSAVLLGGGP